MSLFRLVLLVVAFPAAAQTTFTVTTTADPGDGTCTAAECTLREAIAAANAAPGADLIAFDIPGAGVHTLQPVSAFPDIVGPVTIDGYTQPGARPNTRAVGTDAVLRVEIAGPGTGRYLVLAGTGVVVRGLVINRLGEGLFTAEGSGGHVIAGNFIGTDPTGTLDLGNSAGVHLFRSTGVRVGGTAPADRNVVSGNTKGIEILQGAGPHLVQGNYVGTDATGTAALGNSYAGIAINAPNVIVGGLAPGAGNLISGNADRGIESTDPGVVIQGNLIGTDASGMAAVPNLTGLIATGAPGPSVADNVISGNTSYGIRLPDARGATVRGNRIGVALDGVSPLGNGGHGVLIGFFSGGFVGGGPTTVGGTAPGEANLIAHNAGAGVAVICCEGRPSSILGNAIFGNASLGIDLYDGVSGPTANDPADADGGPNLFQNTPELVAVGSAAGSVTAVYRVDTAPAHATYPLRVEFFRADAGGEGAAYLGADTYSEADYGGCGTPPCPKTAAFLPAAPVADGDPVVATATDAAGNTSEFSAAPGVVVAGAPPAGAPLAIALHAPAPNPAAGPAVLRYDLAAPGPARLAVYDALGREVAVLAEGEHEAGRHEAVLAVPLPAGLYLVRLSTPDGHALHRAVTLLR